MENLKNELIQKLNEIRENNKENNLVHDEMITLFLAALLEENNNGSIKTSQEG